MEISGSLWHIIVTKESKKEGALREESHSLKFEDLADYEGKRAQVQRVVRKI